MNQILQRKSVDSAEPASVDNLVKAFEQRDEKLLAEMATMGQKIGNVEAELLDMGQRLARRGSGEPARDQSWGEQFAESDAVKSFATETSRPGRVRIDVKSTLTTATDSSGSLQPAPFRDDVVMMPKRRLTVRNLLRVIEIVTGSAEYPKQTERTNNADVVAEGNLKPESGYAFEMQTATAKTIAHWVPASRQILEDAPQLAGIIDTELRHGLELKEEQQLLNGSGVGQNLLGMVTQATAYAAPIPDIAAATMIDTIGLAVLQSALAEFPATGIVLHPSDWMRIRLIKDGDGNYILGAPGANVPPVLFGLPVVATQAMAIDKFLVGDFQTAATIYDRWQPRVEVSTEHADFFTRNMVAILAEERIALAVKQPTALTYGDFGNVA
ncbi:phage major capsid protein [Fulvimarina sp. MAC3]|uniref:phage major capsid protein n=1 Tax=Fulvimarina sp. MAC3 TaxID=3148887 RepID=UPI0031FDF834